MKHLRGVVYFKTEDEARQGLVAKCKGCEERRRHCWKPEPDGKSRSDLTDVRVPGVSFNKKKNKWIARETSGNRKSLGSYDSKAEAVLALADGKSKAATCLGLSPPRTSLSPRE